MRALLLVLPLALTGCTSFSYCQRLVAGLENTVDPMVYDYWEARVQYEQDLGGATWNCLVQISASGYIGQKANLERRPKYIDEVLK